MSVYESVVDVDDDEKKRKLYFDRNIFQNLIILSYSSLRSGFFESNIPAKMHRRHRLFYAVRKQ